MKLPSKFRQAVKQSWDATTCYPVRKKDWTKTTPALGQCAVTALLLQDYLGGEIAFNEANDHFWNILPDGKEVDLTREQFKTPVDLHVDVLCKREDILYSPESW